MNTEKNKAVIERLFREVMNGKNYALLSELLAPEFVNHSLPMPQPGPGGFQMVIEGFFSGFPDMKIVLERVIGEGDMVVSTGHWTGTNEGSFMGMPATGKKINIPYIDIWRLENGKAVENWVQMDNVKMLQQMGLMPQPA